MNPTPRLLASLPDLDRPAVLATLVRLEGSGYRRPGARMLLDPDGIRAGALSGGCLEADLAARTEEVLAQGPRLVTYDLGTDLDRVWGTGMGCQGKASILLEPLVPGRLAPWIHFSLQHLRRRRPLALVTVTATEGHPGAVVGDVFAYDDRSHGLLPFDRDLSVACHRLTRQALEEGSTWHTRIPCAQGAVEVMVEALLPPFALWIFGAGEPARPLADLAYRLGFEVHVRDHRPALATEARFPGAASVQAEARTDLGRDLSPDPRTAAVVMGHTYDVDLAVLGHLLPMPLPYLGLQGSRGRCQKLLAEADHPLPAGLRAPMGLDLGGDGPEAVALATLAEISAVLHGRTACPLAQGQGSLHP